MNKQKRRKIVWSTFGSLIVAATVFSSAASVLNINTNHLNNQTTKHTNHTDSTWNEPSSFVRQIPSVNFAKSIVNNDTTHYIHFNYPSQNSSNLAVQNSQLQYLSQYITNLYNELQQMYNSVNANSSQLLYNFIHLTMPDATNVIAGNVNSSTLTYAGQLNNTTFNSNALIGFSFQVIYSTNEGTPSPQVILNVQQQGQTTNIAFNTTAVNSVLFTTVGLWQNSQGGILNPLCAALNNENFTNLNQLNQAFNKLTGSALYPNNLYKITPNNQDINVDQITFQPLNSTKNSYYIPITLTLSGLNAQSISDGINSVNQTYTYHYNVSSIAPLSNESIALTNQDGVVNMAGQVGIQNTLIRIDWAQLMSSHSSLPALSRSDFYNNNASSLSQNNTTGTFNNPYVLNALQQLLFPNHNYIITSYTLSNPTANTNNPQTLWDSIFVSGISFYKPNAIITKTANGQYTIPNPLVMFGSDNAYCTNTNNSAIFNSSVALFFTNLYDANNSTYQLNSNQTTGNIVSSKGENYTYNVQFSNTQNKLAMVNSPNVANTINWTSTSQNNGGALVLPVNGNTNTITFGTTTKQTWQYWVVYADGLSAATISNQNSDSSGTFELKTGNGTNASIVKNLTFTYQDLHSFLQNQKWASCYTNISSKNNNSNSNNIFANLYRQKLQTGMYISNLVYINGAKVGLNDSTYHAFNSQKGLLPAYVIMQPVSSAITPATPYAISPVMWLNNGTNSTYVSQNLNNLQNWNDAANTSINLNMSFNQFKQFILQNALNNPNIMTYLRNLYFQAFFGTNYLNAMKLLNAANEPNINSAIYNLFSIAINSSTTNSITLGFNNASLNNGEQANTWNFLTTNDNIQLPNNEVSISFNTTPVSNLTTSLNLNQFTNANGVNTNLTYQSVAAVPTVSNTYYLNNLLQNLISNQPDNLNDNLMLTSLLQSTPLGQNSAPLLNSDQSVISYENNPQSQDITNILVLNQKTNTIQIIPNLSYANSNASATINIAQATDANYFQQWLRSNTQIPYSMQVPENVFSNLNQITLAPNSVIANKTYNNPTYNVYSSNLTLQHQNMFNYVNWLNPLVNLYSTNNSAQWMTWNVLSNWFLTTIQSQVPTNFTLFGSVHYLFLSNLNLGQVSNTQLINFLQLFPNLQSLTIENCNLQMNDLNLSAFSGLQNLNLSNNALQGSVVLPTSLKNVDVSNNQITSLQFNSQNKNQTLNLNTLDASYNQLNGQNIYVFGTNNTSLGNNNYYLNFSNNQFESVNMDRYFNPNITSQSNSIQSINFANNQIIKITNTNPNNTAIGNDDIVNQVYNYHLLNSSNTAGPVVYQLNLQGQSANANWVFKAPNENNGYTWSNYNSALTANNNGINLTQAFNNNSQVWVKNNTVGNANGIFNNQTWSKIQTNPQQLQQSLSNSSLNGNLYLNHAYLSHANFFLYNNGNISSSVSYSTFSNVYQNVVPFNDVALYQILQPNLPSYSVAYVLNIFNQNFNLQGNTLTKYSLLNPDIPLSVKQAISSLQHSSNNFISIVNSNQVLILDRSTNSYYLSSPATAINTNTNNTLSIVNSNANSSINFHFQIISSNTANVNTSKIASFFNTTSVQFSNVDQFAVNRITSLNGIDTFYNLGESGILTNLTTNPFALGINYNLYETFINAKATKTQTWAQLLNVNNGLANSTATNSNSTFNDYKNMLSKDGKLWTTFENQFYTLLEQEGMIQYNQEFSIYGTNVKNQFTISKTLLDDPYLNLNAPTTNSSVYHFTYGINASPSINDSGVKQMGSYLPSASLSSFYESNLWANFVNTQINPTTTVGQYLFKQSNGTWNYEMPNSSNPVFQYANVKTAYDNLLKTFNLSTNLNSTQFNQQIAKYYPVAFSENVATNQAYNYGTNNKLYNVFQYSQGKIVNVAYLYTPISTVNSNNNMWSALVLNYVNCYQNVHNNIQNNNSITKPNQKVATNTKPVIFPNADYYVQAKLYAPNALSKQNTSFLNTSNLYYSQLLALKLSNPTTYTWKQLETNEVEGLIPQAVYLNQNPMDVNGVAWNSAQSVPEQNFNNIIKEINNQTASNYGLYLGITFGIIVLVGSILLAALLIKHKHKVNTQKSRQEARQEKTDSHRKTTKEDSDNASDDLLSKF